MPVVMISQTTLCSILLAFFSFLPAVFAAPGEDARQHTQEIANGNATTPSITPKPTPLPTPNPDEEEEQEIRRNHRFLADPARASAVPETRIFIGREIPVATQYDAPRITTQANGGYVIQPATPRAFETRRTGLTIDSTGVEQTELENFIDYGSPIRTAVPVSNEKGEIIGTTIQEHPNPILQPVFRTIRKE
jgi:hypothetical protein